MSCILVVDDEESICWSFREFLVDEGHQVESAASAEEALRVAAEVRPDAVILDVRLPGLDGIAAPPRLRERAGGAPIVVMTAFGDLETAVRAVEAEAFDYLVKPFDLDRVAAVVRRALEAGRRPARSGPPAPATDLGETIVGSSPPMQALFRRIALVASAEAEALHDRGPGEGGPSTPGSSRPPSRRCSGPPSDAPGGTGPRPPSCSGSTGPRSARSSGDTGSADPARGVRGRGRGPGGRDGQYVRPR